MRHILLSTFLIWLNYRKRTWTLLPHFFQALIYIAFINSSYYYFFKNRILWELQSTCLSLKALRVIHIFIITPLIFLLCMVNFPKENVRKQMKHIVKWACMCASFEFIGLKSNMIYFKHKWNILWSWLIYILLFSYGYAYPKKPALVWGLSMPTLLFFLIRFKAPFRRVMLFGPILFLVNRFNIFRTLT
ncbi:hypothetical protein BkAM31D_24005 [Halalkalibacter krulwichiae]|uniref:Uncharacterized protein n=1 Tax=Halalkalibacter krulwichiae TaxID=199441 RepID=A0A1X9MJ00_9BACI|nr:hypothetical protein BkAM31D_24005 [Halalkalibacter krulwichiae]